MTTSDRSLPGAPPRRRRHVVRWLWVCLPLAAWLAVIALDSTDIASSAHTDVLLLRLVHLFVPRQAGPGTGGFGALSWLVRKSAHVIEYGILGALLARAVRALLPGFARGQGWELLWRVAVVALPCGLLVSASDEVHQLFVPSRVGAARDVAFDFVGLAVGVVVMWLLWRRRGNCEAAAAESAEQAEV